MASAQMHVLAITAHRSKPVGATKRIPWETPSTRPGAPPIYSKGALLIGRLTQE